MACRINYLPDQFDYLFASAAKIFPFVNSVNQLFIFANPHNFLELSPTPGQIGFLIVAYALQVGFLQQYYILYRQQVYGPDDMLPKLWKTQRFDYMQPIPVMSDNSINEEMEEGHVEFDHPECLCDLHESPGYYLYQRSTGRRTAKRS